MDGPQLMRDQYVIEHARPLRPAYNELRISVYMVIALLLVNSAG